MNFKERITKWLPLGRNCTKLVSHLFLIYLNSVEFLEVCKVCNGLMLNKRNKRHLKGTGSLMWQLSRPNPAIWGGVQVRGEGSVPPSPSFLTAAASLAPLLAAPGTSDGGREPPCHAVLCRLLGQVFGWGGPGLCGGEGAPFSPRSPAWAFWRLQSAAAAQDCLAWLLAAPGTGGGGREPPWCSDLAQPSLTQHCSQGRPSQHRGSLITPSHS